jgi:two-component sensor histidine kinase/HAMP domain-containing protein
MLFNQSLNRSLSLQLFIIITLLTLTVFFLLGLIIVPEIDQKIRDIEQQQRDEKFFQAQLMLDFGNQFSAELDSFVVENHLPELNKFLSPILTYSRARVDAFKNQDISKTEAIRLIKKHVEALNYQLEPYYDDEYKQAMDNHYWLTDDNGQWLFHPQGEPTNISQHHQSSFNTFIESVVNEGQVAKSLPWLGSHLLDTKPVSAVHIKELNLIVGIDFDVDQLPRSPLPAYQALRLTLRKILATASFGENGQVFFFFSDLDYLSSRKNTGLYNTLMELNNPYTGNLYVEDFKKAASQNETIEIIWNHKTDLESYQYPAFARAFYYPKRDVYLVSVSYPEDMDKQPKAIRSYILMGLFLCLLLALFGAWWLSQRIVSPIRKLSNYAQQVGNHSTVGDASKLIPLVLDRQDEVGILAVELNRMVYRLETTITGLDEKVALRTQELEVKNTNLEISLSDKDALLREIHHRVKNNLAVVISFIQLQERRTSDIHLLSVLQSLRSRIFTIELIHNQLYRSDNFSRLNPQKYYSDLLNETWALHNPVNGIQYELQVNIDQQEVEQLLTCGQILNELLSNSLKYAFNNVGLVTIKFSEQDGNIHFFYSDNGCGLSEKACDANSNGVNRGTSLPSSIDLSASDSGLGLILLTHLVKGKLKGELEWESSSEGLRWLIIFPSHDFLVRETADDNEED